MFSKGPSEITFNTEKINPFIQKESQNMNTEKLSSQEQTTNIKKTPSQEQATEKNTSMNNMNVKTDVLSTE
ncbi:1371_t:CDS:1, partial [Cetraspora pellucida]